jgi:hypothetical protein
MKPDVPNDTEFSALLRKTVELLSRYIVPLYTVSATGRPVVCGTGFFVQRSEDTFLVSAAHVFDEALRTRLFFYPSPTVLRSLSGQFRRTNVDGGRVNDRHDVGVLRLDLPHPPFAEIQKFAMPLSYLKPVHLPRTSRKYLIVGFPASRTTLRVFSRQVIAEPYAHWSGPIPDAVYATFGTTPTEHVIVPFRRKRLLNLAGRKIHGANPQGMSGAPIFVFFGGGPPEPTFSVAAVLIEYRRYPEAVLIGTDIGRVLDAMALDGS